MASPHRVLFVEDYPPFKRSFGRILKNAFGLDVTVADSGEEAIGQFGAVNPELVILDLGLPGVGGTETLQVIRALPGGESVPVIVLTGSNDVDLRSAATLLDIDGYVLKENATSEFADVLFAIFPDLDANARAHHPPSAGTIGLDDVVVRDAGTVGRIPSARRAIRVLLPHDAGKRSPGSGHWAHRLVRRARVVLPRMLGGV